MKRKQSIFRLLLLLPVSSFGYFDGFQTHSRKIIAIPYDDSMEYYSFIKECHDTGFRQIIVTSETMIQLIQKIVVARFRVSEIKLTEDEAELIDENKNVYMDKDEILQLNT